MAKMLIAAATASALVYETSNVIDGWSHVAIEEGDEGRWERKVMTVLKGPDGGTYAFSWRQGLTEDQEDRYPWDAVWPGGPVTEIELYPVTSHAVTVIGWRKAAG